LEAEREKRVSALDKPQLRASFERAAATYDATAVLQREIAGRLSARLEIIRHDPRLILDAGCGTGYGTVLLARRYQRARILGVDIAQGMVRRARARGFWFSRRRFVCGDFERLPLKDGVVDMIVSNLTLQWCAPETVFAECRRVLKPGGLLMFTSFGPDTLKELRAAWRAADAGTHVHRFTDMHDLGDALVRRGFADPVMDVESYTLTYGSVTEVLRDLKRLGAHNVAHERARGLTGRSRFARFRAAYEAQAAGSRIPATYEVIYGHAWAPRASDDYRPIKWVGK
jgi:malonyl-CoA O-methyltransferase